MGTISRGNGTRLIRLALSISEVVPEIQAMEKKLNGTSPHIRNNGKLGSELGRTLLKTKVSTPIVTRGFNKDQNTPRDMLRYRMRKSVRTRCCRTKVYARFHVGSKG